MSLFPTKFVADVGILELSGQTDTLQATLNVAGVTVLNEKYSPANGAIIVRGLRQILEAAIYGEIAEGQQTHAAADVVLAIGSHVYSKRLFSSRLRNPDDPEGLKTIMAAGDIVAVASHDGFLTSPLYTSISGNNVITTALSLSTVSPTGQTNTLIGDDIHIWIDFSECPEQCVAIRFLNRYDVPQTMMTTRPLDIKPGFNDQTAMMYGQRIRYTIEQTDEYTLHSGPIHSMKEYASWYDLITSRKAELLVNNQWLPIIVKKSNFQIARRSMGMKPVEITFQMADPRQGL